MPDSKYTKIEDFLLDDSFLEWATGNSTADSHYWNSFIATHPELEDNIKQAAVMLKSIQINPAPELSSTEISDIIQGVKNKIKAAESMNLPDTYTIGLPVSTAAINEVKVINAAVNHGHSDSSSDNVIAVNHAQINTVPVSNASVNNLPVSNTPVSSAYFTINSLRYSAKTLFRYAAILVLSASGILFYTLRNRTNTQKIQSVNARALYRSVVNKNKLPMLVKLPDSSTVILQQGAHLSYSSSFRTDKREVKLTGEAFFEIKKNQAQPFYVYSNELTIRVVGTSFKVMANDLDDQYKVLVSTGRVEVTALTNSNAPINKFPVILMPNQEVILYRKERRLEKDVMRKPMLLSKISTALHFNFSGAPFSEVIKTIEQAYDVHITYDEKVMKNCQLTASLIDQTLDERLTLICKAVEASYIIDDGQIVISGKGCNN